MKTNKLTRGAMIAALYAALTLIFAPISIGSVQCRVSEALCILPMFFPESIWGLFAGCIISNTFIPGSHAFDIIVGSLVTLLAAFLTYKTRKNPYVAISFPVILNAVIVGGYIPFIYPGFPIHISILSVGIGQVMSCYGLGLPLYYILKSKFQK